MALARQHHAAGRLHQAEKLYQKVLQAEPDRPDTLLLLGVLSRRAGKNDVALDLIEKALASKPDYAEAHNNRGNVLLDLGRTDDAIASFNKAVDINPKYAEAHYNLGRSLRIVGRLDEAVASYRRALVIKPDYPQAHNNLRNTLLTMPRPNEGVASPEEAVTADPHLAEAHYRLGNTLTQQGALQDAIAAYRRAVECDPEFGSAFLNLGNNLLNVRQLEDAEEAFSRALEIDPSLAEAEHGLGVIAKLNGQTSEALDHFRRALALDPKLAAALSEMGRVYLIMGDTAAALDCAHRAIAIDPEFRPGYVTLSAALVRDDRRAEAHQASLEAVRLRRITVRDFRGREPVGSVLVLRGLQHAYFRMAPDNLVSISNSGRNNAVAHFDLSRIQQYTFYLDGFDPATEMDQLPDCDIVFSETSDMDTAPRSLEVARSIVERVSVPVINPPDLVAQTRRHLNYQRLRDIEGLLFPPTIQLEQALKSRQDIIKTLDEANISFPILIRCAGTHTGESLAKVERAEQLEAYFLEHSEGPYYVVEFIDFFDKRGGYVKMRAYCVDGILFPNQYFVWPDWNVHVTPLVYEFMSQNKWMHDSAMQFYADLEEFLGPDAFRALNSIYAKLRLDYFGIDFTLMEDGSIFVFEANATMRLPRLTSSELDPAPYRKPGIQAIGQALNQMLERKIGESKALRNR